jgi:hypothetical protein
MTHLTEEDLISTYYGDGEKAQREHLDECSECRAEFRRLSELLDSVREYPVPERDENYGREVWARVAAQLPTQQRVPFWRNIWALAPAIAALLVIAFFAGVQFQKTKQLPGISAASRQRVLALAISDHLQRSEIVLTELAHADSTNLALADYRGHARDLVEENRLLRESALRTGDVRDASLLDEIQRFLIEVANGPAAPSEGDLEALRERIDRQSLLFKIRIVSTDIRHKGQIL